MQILIWMSVLFAISTATIICAVKGAKLEEKIKSNISENKEKPKGMEKRINGKITSVEGSKIVKLNIDGKIETKKDNKD